LDRTSTIERGVFAFVAVASATIPASYRNWDRAPNSDGGGTFVASRDSRPTAAQFSSGPQAARASMAPLDIDTGDTKMADPTHEELDAKLKVAALETDLKLAQVIRQLDISNERTSAAIDKLSTAIVGENGVLSQIKETSSELRADNKFTRWTIAGIIVAALGALWLTQGNLLAAVHANLIAHPIVVFMANNK
jgi:hypothetical protein